MRTSRRSRTRQTRRIPLQCNRNEETLPLRDRRLRRPDGPWRPEQQASDAAKGDGVDSSARDGYHCDQGWAAHDKMSAILSLLSRWMRSRGILVEVCLRIKYLA
jgi:hypothetical protein